MEKDKYSMEKIAALMGAFGKSESTIRRWIRNEDDRLTSDKAKKSLKTVKK